MKKCTNPKCKASIDDDAIFCPECGAKQRQSKKKEQVKEIPSIFDSITARELCIHCGYSYGSPDAILGDVTISTSGIFFQSKSSGFGIFTTLLQGSKSASFQFEEITHMGIMDKGLSLYVHLSDGATHIFWGPTLLNFSQNKECVKKLGYIFELYRRMYWHYFTNEHGVHLTISKPIGSFSNSSVDFDEISDETLVNFFRTI